MPDFRFEPETHTYWLDGVRLPSVSEIIAPIVNLSGIPPGVLAAKAALGSEVHALCELIDHGLLAPRDVDPKLRGYTDAWFRFIDEHPCEWTVIEEPRYHAVRRYAGTPDRYGRVDGEVAIVDIKNVVELRPATGVQLSAYRTLLDPGHSVPTRNLAVQLKPDGTYRIKEYRDETSTFLSLLNIYHWRQANE